MEEEERGAKDGPDGDMHASAPNNPPPPLCLLLLLTRTIAHMISFSLLSFQYTLHPSRMQDIGRGKMPQGKEVLLLVPHMLPLPLSLSSSNGPAVGGARRSVL